MMKTVEIRAVQEQEDGGVAWVEIQDADMFGVYEGEPGDFHWIADFVNMEDGIKWASERAAAKNYDFKNRIGIV